MKNCEEVYTEKDQERENKTSRKIRKKNEKDADDKSKMED